MDEEAGAQPLARVVIDGYLHTALYDTGGESVEGAFVDHWVSNASLAIEELQSVLGHGGLLPQYAEYIRAALAAPDAPHQAAVDMLTHLRAWTKPLIEELAKSAAPALRAIGVASMARVFPAESWLRYVSDPHEMVRLAAIRAVDEQRRSIPDADGYVLQALSDPDLRVSLAAASCVQFVGRPEIGAALVEHLEREPRRAVCVALLRRVAEEVRRAGVHWSGAALEPLIGAPVRALLLRELDNDDAGVRQAIASALERLRGEEVATRMLERFLAEQDYDVHAQILLFNGFQAIAERAFPFLADLLTSPTTLYRVRAAFLLEAFGERAVAPLMRALNDAEPGVRRAAAMSLGRTGNVWCLPALIHAFHDPAMRRFERELDSAIHAVRFTPPPPASDLSATIARRMSELNPVGLGDWPVRVCRDELGALPLHSSMLFIWAVRPDGRVLRMDHEAFGHPVEQERDPLALFAVAVNGARRYPELTELIPACPDGVVPCKYCGFVGNEYTANGDLVSCSYCSGLGWSHRR